MAKILLVEDNKGLSLATVGFLSDAGHDVVHVPSAEDALRLLESGARFHLVITDFKPMAGGMNGVALGRHIETGWPDIGVILTTGYMPGDIETSFPVLYKPYTVTELLTAVDAELVTRTINGKHDMTDPDPKEAITSPAPPRASATEIKIPGAPMAPNVRELEAEPEQDPLKYAPEWFRHHMRDVRENKDALLKKVEDVGERIEKSAAGHAKVIEGTLKSHGKQIGEILTKVEGLEANDARQDDRLNDLDRKIEVGFRERSERQHKLNDLFEDLRREVRDRLDDFERRLRTVEPKRNGS